MNKSYYHILPVPAYRIWAGPQLKERYGYESEEANIGELYNVIAMPGHLDCTVRETGEPLSAFYQNHPELFRCSKPEMPVRAAMACTAAPMSVQVHPDDAYALAHDGRLGKPDGVYFIEGESQMELGHLAKSREEFERCVNDGDWDSLLRYIPVKGGEFVSVPYGTLHAFGPGLTQIEFSQNADLTYRLYDYDRREPDGSARELHIEKVCECVRVPNADPELTPLHPVTKNGVTETVFHSEPGVYTAGKLETDTEGTYERPEFWFLTVIDGHGAIDGMPLEPGETILVPAENGPVTLTGPIECTYVTYEEPR